MSIDSKGTVFPQFQPEPQSQPPDQTDSEIDRRMALSRWWLNGVPVADRQTDRLVLCVSSLSGFLPRSLWAGALNTPDSSGEYLSESDGAERETYTTYIFTEIWTLVWKIERDDGRRHSNRRKKTPNVHTFKIQFTIHQLRRGWKN